MDFPLLSRQPDPMLSDQQKQRLDAFLGAFSVDGRPLQIQPWQRELLEHVAAGGKIGPMGRLRLRLTPDELLRRFREHFPVVTPDG